MNDKEYHWFVAWFAEVYAWMANGQGLAGQLKYPFALAVSLKLFIPTADFQELLIYGLIAFILIVFIGWFDLKFIRLHQATAEIQTERYNPYFSKLRKSLKGFDASIK